MDRNIYIYIVISDVILIPDIASAYTNIFCEIKILLPKCLGRYKGETEKKAREQIYAETVNSFKMSDEFMSQLINSSLIEIMACLLRYARPLSWTNSALFSIEMSGASFSEIWIKIQWFSIKKTHSEMSSAKWLSFTRGLNLFQP